MTDLWQQLKTEGASEESLTRVADLLEYQDSLERYVVDVRAAFADHQRDLLDADELGEVIFS